MQQKLLERKLGGIQSNDVFCSGSVSFVYSLSELGSLCALCDTDFWQAYRAVLPSQRHRSVGKESGQTNHIERFNWTLRQHVSRLVRKTFSFSKKLENHIREILCFIHYYNASLPL